MNGQRRRLPLWQDDHQLAAGQQWLHPDSRQLDDAKTGQRRRQIDSLSFTVSAPLIASTARAIRLQVLETAPQVRCHRRSAPADDRSARSGCAVFHGEPGRQHWHS